MLILFKPSFKTSLFLLLFIGGSKTFAAASLPMINPLHHQFHTSEIQLNYSEQTYSFVQDTIQPEISKTNPTVKVESLIPDSLADMPINFQINSEIHYLSLKHFRNDESEKTFLQARNKESELGNVSIQTDSLRKAYSGSTSEEKDKIAIQILKNEEYATVLNQEIETLYQTARDKEEQYWQTQSSGEKSQFQKKVKAFSDSLTLSKQNKEIEQAAKILIDTMFISHESEVKHAKAEPPVNAIVYKIQIGAFKGKVPELSAKMIKKLSVLRKVENYTDEKGIKIYTTGNLKTYQEAVTMQNQVKQEGVKNPTIIAFQKGKKISVDEAKKNK